MDNFIDDFIKKNNQQFLKYRKYLENNDWTTTKPSLSKKEKTAVKKDEDLKQEKFSYLLAELKYRKEESEIQYKLAKVLAQKLSYFCSEASSDAHLKKYKDFVKSGIEILKIHIDRCEDYNDSVDIEDIPYHELKQSEISFHNDLFKYTADLQKHIRDYNFREDLDEYDSSKIEFFNKKKAPLITRELLSLVRDDVKEKTEKIPVDWSLRTSKEMFKNINPKDVPKWNYKKHFFEQDPVVLSFWSEEYNKICHGVTIGGYFIHPWLYFHLNFFRTPIPQPDGSEPNANPDLRDNEWFFAENLKKCINPDNPAYYSKAVLMYGTRRFGKSVILASLAHWRTITKFNSFGSIIGGSSSDINALTSKIKTSMSFIDEPFRLDVMKQEWDNGETTFGIKEDAQTPRVFSTLIVQNLESGAKKSSQKTAGLAPSVSIYDEIGKYSFLKSYLAALPSFKTPYGFKCVTVLAGTGGEADLSKDAVDVLSSPESYDLLPMDWDLLENNIDPEHISWKKRKFATFFPGQMAYEEGFIKKKKKFSDFLKIDDEELAKIDMHVTDWENNTKMLLAKIDDAKKMGGSKGKLLEQQRRVQYPIDPEDCFMSTEDNIFPAIEAQNRKNYILETGDTGKKVTLFEDKDGSISYDMSDKPLAEYPHNGGFIDAPCLMFEELPKERPVDYLYLAGFDDYKQEESGTDSVGSFYIYKVNIGQDKWSGRIVFSIATRPDPHNKLYRQIFLAMKAYNAKCFMENADMGFKEYLDRHRVADLWLVESFDFKADIGATKSTGRRRFGWTPTPENKRFLKNLVRDYVNKEHIKIIDGEEKQILGIDLINDVGLLDEFIYYKPDNNVDRITAFMSCLGFEYYAFANWLLPTADKLQERDKERKPKPKEQKNLATAMFGKNRRNRYF